MTRESTQPCPRALLDYGANEPVTCRRWPHGIAHECDVRKGYETSVANLKKDLLENRMIVVRLMAHFRLLSGSHCP